MFQTILFCPQIKVSLQFEVGPKPEVDLKRPVEGRIFPRWSALGKTLLKRVSPIRNGGLGTPLYLYIYFIYTTLSFPVVRLPGPYRVLEREFWGGMSRGGRDPHTPI